MVGTYAATLLVCGASLAIGQAAIGLCGVRRWSWLSPAVGLALLCAICWGTVRLPGDGLISAVLVAIVTVAAVAYSWRGRLEVSGGEARIGLAVGLLALAAASLPFVVEGHFGILGTSFNPDMSQHLLAADRLADGQGSQLLHQGYPLGPHSIVVALNKGLGVGLVQGFSGLTVAVAILASLTALAAFRDLPLLPRTAGALLVGLAYLVASYFAQGAFKETMQVLFFLAFVLALREATGPWRTLPLRFLPAALLGVGSVYTYSFPGLIWLGGAAAIWAITEAARTRGTSAPLAGGGGRGSSPTAREDEDPLPPTGPAARADSVPHRPTPKCCSTTGATSRKVHCSRSPAESGPQPTKSSGPSESPAWRAPWLPPPAWLTPPQSTASNPGSRETMKSPEWGAVSADQTRCRGSG